MQGPVAKPKLKPSAWWYACAPLIAIAGPILAVVLFVTGLTNAVSQLEAVGATGSTTVSLDKGDVRGVYGRPLADVALECTVSSPSGQAVPVDGVTGTITLSNGNGEWRAVGFFTARETGTYTLDCPAGAAATLGPDPSVSGVFGFVGGVLALVFGGPLLGIVSFFVVLMLRSASKRRFVAPAFAGSLSA